jgi:hypothetical protein
MGLSFKMTDELIVPAAFIRRADDRGDADLPEAS